jgi:tRNA-splicing ligase RtcB
VSVLKKIDDYRWMVPQNYKPGMKVPGIIYAKESMIKEIEKDQSIEQVANAATLPGIVKASLAMPDIHYGYGLPIGGVVATDISQEGVITPGGVGFDINCGVRLLRTSLSLEDVEYRIEKIIDALFSMVPTGVGSKGPIKLTKSDYRRVLEKGALWAVERGYGWVEDLDNTESRGNLPGADPSLISDKAIERGKNQMGTLGSGNHFLEVQVVEQLFNQELADAMGIFHGQVTLMIHSGSRGFGHQVCTDFLRMMEKALQKYHIQVPDRQLACAFYNTQEGKDYMAAMACAANYAWANRQCLAHWARQALSTVLGKDPQSLGMKQVYDVAHNIVKIEDHFVDGKSRRLAVHRKGATRAFPPDHPELPPHYKHTGQPVLIPGDMGRASYLLAGTQKAMEETFGSTCHGAGRLLSRHAAKKALKGKSLQEEINKYGIYERAASKATLVEEMPLAYKDISQVVDVVCSAGIAKLVARMRPLGGIKG